MYDMKNISEIALDGIEKANLEYERISGGNWITDAGVESFASCYIASEIHRGIRNSSVHLEVAPSYVLKESGAKPISGPHPLRIAGLKRIDIVAYKKERPIIVCEVKKLAGSLGVSADIARIGACLTRAGSNRGGSLECGLFVAYFSNRKKSNGKYKEIKSIEFEKNVRMACYKNDIEKIIYIRRISTPMYPDYTLWACCVAMESKNAT